MSQDTRQRGARGSGRIASSAAPRGRRRSRLERLLGRHPVGLLLTAPYAVFVAAIFLYPIGFGVWMSFHDFFFTAPGVDVPTPFVGFDNYVTVLSDPDIRASFLHVAEFLVINVPLTVVISLLLATALNSVLHWRGFLRVSYYVPYVAASVAMVTVWMFMFNSTGIVNQILGPLAPDPSWLVSKAWAMPSIAIYVTWKQLGFFILLFLAALQNVPKELNEAAAMDGANRWQCFRTVTIPAVRPATTLVVLLAIITGANLFTEPYLLTGGGGPNGASTTPVFLLYQQGIQQGNPDVASAIGVLLVIAVLAITYVSRKVTERD
ncbi:carbohydrate ABC transporter permease [Pengzhenrongella sicca]|uniref:Sugar ABC transporter permease n=1 Tax=Pengzhenrongella sicca TaxID=2819238 RepID=A0A8A4ZFJ9_9MICO|nr:sugar ABC transporter permease [Pengzhenrongella sicca]QTE30181.1 sugar ABC transporter permease [Pengzhenrongella sicca]